MTGAGGGAATVAAEAEAVAVAAETSSILSWRTALEEEEAAEALPFPAGGAETTVAGRAPCSGGEASAFPETGRGGDSSSRTAPSVGGSSVAMAVMVGSWGVRSETLGFRFFPTRRNCVPFPGGEAGGMMKGSFLFFSADESKSAQPRPVTLRKPARNDETPKGQARPRPGQAAAWRPAVARISCLPHAAQVSLPS